ncbi:MAG: hypothetical protein HYX48_06360 [Chlamydiales bacterium]|nr:hypothetical protein [Chlamydiales bacterium]
MDYLPSWVIFILTILISVCLFEGGFRLGNYRRKRSKAESKAPLSSIMGATLGLLAFTLAFTFSLAASRFLERRDLVLTDANAIETTYRRAEYLPEPNQTIIRDLLREYVAIRNPSGDLAQLKQIIERSEQLQNKLWAQAVVIAKSSPNSVVAGLFIQSLNEMFDLHAKRVMTGAIIRIPDLIWAMLCFVVVLSMVGMGYYSGLTGARSVIINLAMILTFSGVVFLIADLDNSQGGFVRVSQQPMLDLLKKISPS